MPALIDLTGQRFGILRVAVRLADRITPSGARQPRWGCVCDCGRRTIEEGRALRAGRALSCRQCVRDPSRTLKYGRVYLIYYPAHRVLKIGFHTSSTRLRELLGAGGIHLEEFRDVDKSWETAGRRALDSLFEPAFTNRRDASRVIPRGAGWTDCYTVDPEDLILARSEVFEACLREGNSLGENPPATPTWLRALTRIQSARRRARVGCADLARSAGTGGGAVTDSVGRRVDREAAARRDAARLGGRPHRARRARPRGRRARRHMGAGRPRMARSAPNWARRTPACSRPIWSLLGAALDGAHFHRLGRERKRGGAREGARAGARACEGACRGRAAGVIGTLGAGVLETATSEATATPSPVGRSTARMPGSPQRNIRRVRTLRPSRRYPQDVAGQREVHGGAGALRGIAGDAVGGPGQ